METFGMVVNVLWDFIAACEAEDVVASMFVIKEQSNWRAHVMWHVLFHGYMVTQEKHLLFIFIFLPKELPNHKNNTHENHKWLKWFLHFHLKLNKWPHGFLFIQLNDFHKLEARIFCVYKSFEEHPIYPCLNISIR